MSPEPKSCHKCYFAKQCYRRAMAVQCFLQKQASPSATPDTTGKLVAKLKQLAETCEEIHDHPNRKARVTGYFPQRTLTQYS